jgi:hypothetical protein
MDRKKVLIQKVFNLLSLIENEKNQHIIRKIEGLLYELLDS